jgi:hypothetical protein
LGENQQGTPPVSAFEESTDMQLVTRLLRLTFEAQIPPTFFALAYLIQWLIEPENMLGAMFQVRTPSVSEWR